VRVTTAVTSTGRAVDQALVGVGATQYRIPGQGSPLCSRNHSLWSLLQCRRCWRHRRTRFLRMPLKTRQGDTLVVQTAN
jgi:hypothetical protein